MVAAPSSSSPVSRATAIESVLKSKGLQTLDDLEDPEEPLLLQLQAHHNLVVMVEMCQAQRPSKLGSLKGSHEKYEEEFTRLEQTLGTIAGEGSVEFIKWEPGMPAMPSSSSVPPPPANSGRRSRPQSAGTVRSGSRPQSAAVGSQNAQLRAYMGMQASERLAPRIGAFEVCYKLVNTQSGQQYGPVEVFSKIASGHWPGPPSLLVKRVQEELQGFLRRDMGNGMLFQHAQTLAKEAKETARPGRPVLQQAEDLPDPEPPAMAAAAEGAPPHSPPPHAPPPAAEPPGA